MTSKPTLHALCHAFIEQRYMKSLGRLGGQNKVPRLGNDRKVAEGLIAAG